MAALNTTLGNPLTNAQLSNLNQALYLLNQLVAKLDQAERAGIDVSAVRAERDELYNRVIMIKTEYFPNSP